jgi:succinate-semialdehyde dehydrogenase/glutarate-semialdehyde dehydrogenase
VAIASVNPATGETVKSFEALSPAEIELRLERAATAAASYRRTTFAERATLLRRAAAILREERDATAELMTLEMGKTITSARAEVEKCAKGCDFYAEHGAGFLADEPVEPAGVGAVEAYGRYQPLGPVLAVMPWNFPLWQAMRFAAPALMAGNVGLLKHASNVPQTALYLEDLFRRAGFPEGVFQTLLITSGQVERVLRDARVKAATLTGSGPAGQSVAAIAGDAIKKTVLELGGSDPFLVLASADLERAAKVATVARCQNNGQSCIAAKRFIVVEEVADAFESHFTAAMAALTVGDPRDPATDIGPLATEQGREDVEELVADALAKGARLRCGGQRLPGPGWYYPATVLSGITPAMRGWSEEVFGPVALVIRAADLDEAIRVANDTPFGLGSNVWTSSSTEAARCVDEIEAGAVFVNGMTTSYPELPFGGVKESGYGRELSAHGIREFCNLKTVWVGAGLEE